MQNNEVVTYTPIPETRRAMELIMQSRYIRLITPNGIRRVSRRVAMDAVNDTTRCADCIGGVSWCEACKYIDNALTVRGTRIYLNGTIHGAIIQP